MNLIKKIIYTICAPCHPNRSATVRFAFPLVFAFAALIGTAALLDSSGSYIHLKSSTQSVKAGESFTIDVYAFAHVPVNAIDIKLRFPKEYVQIEGIDTGDSVITLWTQEPYVEKDTVILRGGTFRKGFRGDHKIATINAVAVETGLAQISVGEVLLLAGDGSGSKVAVQPNADTSKTVYIADELGQFPDGASGDATAVALQGNATIVVVTDIDNDGQVTLTDISRFMSEWRSKGIVYDFNGDGQMTFRDFGIILAHYFLR